MNKSRSELPAPLPASVLGDGTERYDVVVIGFGIAGGSAALEAARAGVRVLLLERAAVHGGTTCMAGGHFYLGGGTAVQQATGHEDSAEEMYKYLVAVSKEPEHDKIRAYCEGSVEHFGWLESLGFEFERSYFPDKAVIQPGTEGLMFTGNEKVWPFRDQAKPAPRGHKVPVPGDTRGAKLVMEQSGSAAYLIVDSAHVEQPQMPLVPVLDGYETVAEMEAGLGMPAGSLEKTLARYNHHAALGEDPDFRKSADWLAPQDRSPWAVFDLRLGHALYAGFTLGGLCTTVDAQVQRPDGSVIPGLYAAGACASNIAQDGKGYGSGTQLGEGSFFGRRGGSHAAQLLPASQPTRNRDPWGH